MNSWERGANKINVVMYSPPQCINLTDYEILQNQWINLWWQSEQTEARSLFHYKAKINDTPLMCDVRHKLYCTEKSKNHLSNNFKWTGSQVQKIISWGEQLQLFSHLNTVWPYLWPVYLFMQAGAEAWKGHNHLKLLVQGHYMLQLWTL